VAFFGDGDEIPERAKVQSNTISLGYRVCRDGLGPMVVRRTTMGSSRVCEE
jgi:hypothetical protein